MIQPYIKCGNYVFESTYEHPNKMYHEYYHHVLYNVPQKGYILYSFILKIFNMITK